MPSTTGLTEGGLYEVGGNPAPAVKRPGPSLLCTPKRLDRAGSEVTIPEMATRRRSAPADIGRSSVINFIVRAHWKASMRKLAALLCATITVSSAIAGPPTPNELQCDFDASVSSVARPGSSFFETEIRREPGLHSITFSDINPLSRSAWTFGGDIDSGRAIVDVWEATWTFTEFTYEGNIFVTQVFIEDEPEAARDLYRAVRSRQWTAMGSVFATQQYGRCKAFY